MKIYFEVQARPTEEVEKNLIPGYKPETSLDCHDLENVISNFSSHTLSDS